MDSILKELFESEKTLTLTCADLQKIAEYAAKLGTKRVRAPRVYTPEQIEANKAKMAALSEKRRQKKEAQRSVVSESPKESTDC